jgi:hypothetical protein
MWKRAGCSLFSLFLKGAGGICVVFYSKKPLISTYAISKNNPQTTLKAIADLSKIVLEFLRVMNSHEYKRKAISSLIKAANMASP